MVATGTAVVAAAASNRIYNHKGAIVMIAAIFGFLILLAFFCVVVYASAHLYMIIKGVILGIKEMPDALRNDAKFAKARRELREEWQKFKTCRSKKQ